MFPSASREVPGLVANLIKIQSQLHVNREQMLPISQRTRRSLMEAPGIVCDIIKYQHQLVDKNDETSEEKPTSQLFNYSESDC